MFWGLNQQSHIWLLSNRKSSERKGKVQLVDASDWFVPLRKNLGKKNCEFSEDQIQQIADLIVNPKETEQSESSLMKPLAITKLRLNAL